MGCRLGAAAALARAVPRATLAPGRGHDVAILNAVDFLVFLNFLDFLDFLDYSIAQECLRSSRGAWPHGCRVRPPALPGSLPSLASFLSSRDSKPEKIITGALCVQCSAAVLLCSRAE